MAPRKDNVALICDIGELAGLFEKSTSLNNFLQNATNIVAYHMKAAVCSVYLYEEERQELILTANQGLNPESIGRVRLKLGEGLVGTALKELRPIREGEAHRNPLFKLIPGIHEERYRAFLAVPILRGQTRVGVLVVQDPVANYFDENDTKALQAIAAQLAATIENAKLLMSLRKQQETKPAERVPAELRFFRGKPTSDGYGLGKSLVLGSMDEQGTQGSFTLEDFRRAVQRTVAQIEKLQRTMEERMADVASLIFSAHLLIVKDDQFSGQMASLIECGMAPPEAIRKVVGEYIGLFSASGNPRLREKVQDVKDLGRRLIQNLRSDVQEGPDYRGVVVIATDLLPSDILKISAQGAEGLLMIGGGTTSHVSILARSLGLPVVVADDRRFFGLPADSTILLDGDQGNVFVNPPADVVKKFRELAESRRQADAYDEDECSDAVTACGERVEIMANINLLSEIAVARKMGACGIGLYRSEFPFIVRSDFPSEEEQCGIYRRILSDMEGRPVVFRTLDVGGDKMLSYFPNISEANPFLGLRAIRFSLRNKSIFSEQLRALLRAGAEADLRIMFPLVSSVDDFVEAREVVRECIQELAREGIPHCAAPKLGAMVELPSAVEVAGELADEADFLSIGSNDLVQYVLAVDRTNEHISDLYVSYHPAVLRAMSRVASAASQRGKPLSLCGEIAADPRMMSFLLGIGIRSLSVEVRHIRNVKKRVGQTRLDEARRQADHLLSLGRIRDVEAAIRG